METITVIADIHPDGDVYILNKGGQMERIGCLGESDFKNVPDKYYTKVLNMAKKQISPLK